MSINRISNFQDFKNNVSKNLQTIPENNNQVSTDAKIKDTVTFMGKSIKKKTLVTGIITGLSAITLLAVAIAKRKDIANLFQKKVKTNIPISDNKANNEIVQEIKEITIPTNGYDSSKEVNIVRYNAYNQYIGFSTRNACDFTDEKTKSLINKVEKNGPIIGKKDNRAFVKIGGTDFYNQEKTKHDEYANLLTHILLISPDDKFTPAQLNLIALAQQDKFLSKNSPFYKVINKDKTLSREEILNLIAKWAQDINPDDKSTMEVFDKVQRIHDDEIFYSFDHLLEKKLS